MKVIFVQSVPGVATRGEVKNVREGHARNYLFPKKLAVPASSETVERLQAEQKRKETKEQHEQSALIAMLKEYSSQPVCIKAKSNNHGKLFGSVGSKEIAERLTEIAGKPINPDWIDLAEPLREIGDHRVNITVPGGVTMQCIIRIEQSQ